MSTAEACQVNWTSGRPSAKQGRSPALSDLARKQRLLAQKIGQAEELADDIAFALAELEAEEDARTERPPQAHSHPAWKNATQPRQDREALRRTAESGASSLELSSGVDGAARVRIDGGKQFALPPLLGDVLSALAADAGRSEDPWVEWKTHDELIALLAKKTGKRLTRHAVTQAIYRLRKEIYVRGNVNPFFVQTHRRYGARFALRRSVVPVIEADRE